MIRDARTGLLALSTMAATNAAPAADVVDCVPAGDVSARRAILLFRLTGSCNVQKRLRQFDQVTPWIAEKRETQRQSGRVPRFADNPHVTTSQFTDRDIDILNAQAQMVPSGDCMGVDQLVVLGTRRAAGTGNQLDAKTVVSSRGKKSQRFFAQCHRADQAKIERAGVPGCSALKVRHAQPDMVASPGGKRAGWSGRHEIVGCWHGVLSKGPQKNQPEERHYLCVLSSDHWAPGYAACRAVVSGTNQCSSA